MRRLQGCHPAVHHAATQLEMNEFLITDIGTAVAAICITRQYYFTLKWALTQKLIRTLLQKHYHVNLFLHNDVVCFQYWANMWNVLWVVIFYRVLLLWNLIPKTIFNDKLHSNIYCEEYDWNYACTGFGATAFHIHKSLSDMVVVSETVPEIIHDTARSTAMY